jgi:hypothetical protein
VGARSPRTLVLLCVLGTLACARASEAQNVGKMQKRAVGKQGGGGSSGHVELTAFNGIQLPKDLYASGGAKIGLADQYVWGGRVAYHPNDKLGIEVSYGRARSALEVRSSAPGFADSTALGGQVVHEYDVGVLLASGNQPGGKSQGFMLLGVGETRFVGDIPVASGDLNRTRFAWHVGIGSKLRLGTNSALRIEARYRSTNTDTHDTLYTDTAGNAFAYAPHWYRTAEITAGLTYKIGG